MAAEKILRLEIGEMKIKVPQRVVLQKLMDEMNGVPSRNIAPQDRPPLGQYWKGEGGIYIGDMMPRNGKPGYSLISPVADCVRGKKFQWGAHGEDESGAQCRFDGHTNTVALRESKHSHPAADWTAEIDIENHRDFYWPSQCESWLQFMNGGDDFEKVWHWTSTQYSPYSAWILYFENGLTTSIDEDYEFAVRPVRRVIHSVI